MVHILQSGWLHLLFLLCLVPLFLLVRLYPIWPRRFQGCDAYNILLNAEAFRRTKRLPIRVPPIFMLENEEQWYPPGFLVFCAMFPERWLQKRYWLVNHLTDFGSAALIYLGAVWLGADAYGAFSMALLYAMVSGLVGEFATLNVRPLGLVLFNAVMLSAYAATQDLAWLPVAGVLAAALFYSHKLSVQQLWFTLPVLGFANGTWQWLAVLALLYMLPFAVWPRGAWRILRGHWVIIRFWHRNWRRLGAHAVRQSPVYGDGQTRTDVYADDSARVHLAFAKDALHQNYFILPVLAALLTGAGAMTAAWPFLGLWVASVYAWAIAIHFLKPLRGIGLGRQYFKFSLAPSLIMTAIALSNSAGVFVWGAAVVAVLLTIRQYLLIARLMRETATASTGGESTELQQLLARLRNEDAVAVMTLPVHLSDLVAYRTRRPVYWGTHSDVFDDRLEAFFPVLKHKLDFYARDGVKQLLLDTDYARPEELLLDDGRLIDVSGKYRLYRLHFDAGDSHDVTQMNGYFAA